MGKTNINKKSSRVALLGVLGAEALALSFLEIFIPAVPGLPPGAKPGFSNIVTMFTASTMGLCSALAITLIKSIFAFIARGVTAGLMSGAGGLLSTLIMVLLLKWKKNPFGITGISVASAVAHNLGQLIVACILSGTSALVWSYGPLLLLFAIITGAVTGAILKIILPALEKQKKAIGVS